VRSGATVILYSYSDYVERGQAKQERKKEIKKDGKKERK
jgi:hypothetical protein